MSMLASELESVELLPLLWPKLCLNPVLLFRPLSFRSEFYKVVDSTQPSSITRVQIHLVEQVCCVTSVYNTDPRSAAMAV